MKLARLLEGASNSPVRSLDEVPEWVRSFFHKRTLSEILRIVPYLRDRRQYFFLASLLGILHHQRPGFLSYPSSHLVPYLRSRKFPRDKYPELYEYRDPASRLTAKVKRSLARPPESPIDHLVLGVRRASIEHVTLPSNIDCVITSPPYMNALDYGRDNRLRRWFLGSAGEEENDYRLRNLKYFSRIMRVVAQKLESHVRSRGYCVFIVSDKTRRSGQVYPSRILVEALAEKAPSLNLIDVIADTIPDVRRSRRALSGTKRENIIIYRKE